MLKLWSFNIKHEKVSEIISKHGLHDDFSNMLFRWKSLFNKSRMSPNPLQRCKFSSNSMSELLWRMQPIPYRPRFKTQFTFSAGLRYEWPGAVLTAKFDRDLNTSVKKSWLFLRLET